MWRQANVKRAEKKAYSTTKQNNTLEERKNAKNNTQPKEETINVSITEKSKVKKKLILLNTITDSLKREFNKADTKEKKVLKKVATNDIANKYKLKTAISNVLGLKGRRNQ